MKVKFVIETKNLRHPKEIIKHIAEQIIVLCGHCKIEGETNGKLRK